MRLQHLELRTIPLSPLLLLQLVLLQLLSLGRVNSLLLISIDRKRTNPLQAWPDWRHPT